MFRPFLTSIAILALTGLVGCSTTKTPDVAADIRKSLDSANLKSVSVAQDGAKGVVTLGGHVAADADKAQAESIAKSLAGSEVVANEVAVLPPGAEHDAKAMSTDLDKGIGSNLDAALIQQKLRPGVKYDVKNGVVTLTGQVTSQAQRDQTQTVAAAVPNVSQVVNELQVKDQKASSSN